MLCSAEHMVCNLCVQLADYVCLCSRLWEFAVFKCETMCECYVYTCTCNRSIKSNNMCNKHFGDAPLKAEFFMSTVAMSAINYAATTRHMSPVLTKWVLSRFCHFWDIGSVRKYPEYSLICYFNQVCILKDRDVLVSWSRTVKWRT